MKKIVLASNNSKKIKEIKEILKGFNYEVFSLNDMNINIDVEEDGKTFEENSQKKANEIYKYLKSMGEQDFLVLADDSGLEVDSLNGAPGVYSARYAGENATDELNNEKLIESLKGIGNRKAKFVSVISLAKPNGEVYSFRGEVDGIIIDEPRGKNGFGYDPYFYYVAYGRTFAELDLSEKNGISHRARALSKMKNQINEILDK